jgi:hypothetical protein
MEQRFDFDGSPAILAKGRRVNAVNMASRRARDYLIGWF